MEIVKSGYTSYGITIRYHEKKVAESKDYDKFISMLERKGVIIHCIVYEEDNGTTYSGKHVHGVVYIKKHCYRKGLQLPGYHVKLEEIYNWSGWMKYLDKGGEMVQYADSTYIPTESDHLDYAAYLESLEDHNTDCCINLFKLVRDRRNNI